MKEKYFEAICAFSEILLERNNELNWKDTQLDMRDKEINTLKIKIEYLENHLENVSKRKD